MQIADGGYLEPQMFGLTTKFNKKQQLTTKPPLLAMCC